MLVKTKEKYEYDMLGRIIKEEVNDEKSTKLIYSYDARGNVINVSVNSSLVNKFF